MFSLTSKNIFSSFLLLLALVFLAGVTVLTIAHEANLSVWYVVPFLIAQAFLWGYTSYGWYVFWVACVSVGYINHGLAPVLWHLPCLPVLAWVKWRLTDGNVPSSIQTPDNCQSTDCDLQEDDWDLDISPLYDLSLRCVIRLWNWLTGEYVPAPLTGYAALETRCRGELRAKNCRHASYALRTGEPAPGFVGGDGSAYYDNLRAIERRLRSEQEAVIRRQQELESWEEASRAAVAASRAAIAAERSLAPRKTSSKKPRSTQLTPGYWNPVPCPRPRRNRQDRQDPLPDPMFVCLGPSFGKPFDNPLELMTTGTAPPAPAAPASPWIPATTALVSVPEQPMDLEPVPEQPMDLEPVPICQLPDMPIYPEQQLQITAVPYQEPEFAVGIEQPQPVIYSGPPASVGWAPEVDMLDAPGMAEEEILLVEPAEPRSHQVPEESTQVDIKIEQAAAQPLAAPEPVPIANPISFSQAPISFEFGPEPASTRQRRQRLGAQRRRNGTTKPSSRAPAPTPAPEPAPVPKSDPVPAPLPAPKKAQAAKKDEVAKKAPRSTVAEKAPRSTAANKAPRSTVAKKAPRSDAKPQPAPKKVTSEPQPPPPASQPTPSAKTDKTENDPILDDDDLFDDIVAFMVAEGVSDEEARVQAAKQLGW
ncbi:hypothetical protein Hte_011977 [Hypoxylon texense]